MIVRTKETRCTKIGLGGDILSLPSCAKVIRSATMGGGLILFLSVCCIY